jgi:hypothetical protein
MGFLMRFILIGLFFYIIVRLLRMVLFTRRTNASPDEATAHDRNSTLPRVDKTKAVEADFEEIKDK